MFFTATSVMNQDESDMEISSVRLNVIKQLTRYIGQTVADVTLSDVMPYNPCYGFGVKVIGLKVKLSLILYYFYHFEAVKVAVFNIRKITTYVM